MQVLLLLDREFFADCLEWLKCSTINRFRFMYALQASASPKINKSRSRYRAQADFTSTLFENRESWPNRCKLTWVLKGIVWMSPRSLLKQISIVHNFILIYYLWRNQSPLVARRNRKIYDLFAFRCATKCMRREIAREISIGSGWPLARCFRFGRNEILGARDQRKICFVNHIKCLIAYDSCTGLATSSQRPASVPIRHRDGILSRAYIKMFPTLITIKFVSFIRELTYRELRRVYCFTRKPSPTIWTLAQTVFTARDSISTRFDFDMKWAWR